MLGSAEVKLLWSIQLYFSFAFAWTRLTEELELSQLFRCCNAKSRNNKNSSTAGCKTCMLCLNMCNFTCCLPHHFKKLQQNEGNLT